MIIANKIIIPKLINFSAIPVTLRPSHTTRTAGIANRILPICVDTPINSERMRPLPFV